MAVSAVELRWAGEGLRFEGGAPGGPAVQLDSAGRAGPSPTQATLLGLAGCMSVDVIDILQKMRVSVEGLETWTEGDRAEEPPRRFLAVRMVFRLRGVSPDDLAKVERAVALSREKYCSVLHTWRPDVDLETEIVLE